MFVGLLSPEGRAPHGVSEPSVVLGGTLEGGLNMEKAKGPNAEPFRELALEDRELLKMLPSNGRYKPDTRSPTD
jgi:hypothetical protein